MFGKTKSILKGKIQYYLRIITLDSLIDVTGSTHRHFTFNLN